MQPIFYLRRNAAATSPFFSSLFSSISSSVSPSTTTIPHFFSTSTTITTTNKSPLFNYLTQTLSFPKQRALSISNRYRTSLQQPEPVVQFLHQFGFSGSQVRTTVHKHPQILFSDVDRDLKPNLDYFHVQLGISVFDLGDIIPKNPLLLISSLDKKLIPFVNIFKRILVHDKGNNRDLIRVLERSSMLIATKESVLRERVSRVLGMGFRVDSEMFVHALLTVCGMSDETFRMKFKLFTSFGFSEDECMEMFRKFPVIFQLSIRKLTVKLEFFFKQMGDDHFDRSVLVYQPMILTYDVEKRVIPRLRVLRIIKSKGLTEKDRSLINVLCVSKEKFSRRFILKYKDDSEELLMAYEGCKLLNS